MKAKEAKSAAAQEGDERAARSKYLSREEYRQALAEVERFLSFVYFRLDELKADLAVEGSHKKWADAQGPVLSLDEIDFFKSDDPILRDVHGLHVQLERVLDHLPIGPGGKLKDGERRARLH